MESVSKYRIFCMVVESGSFTKTAEEIGYSQSAVSQMVKAMEKEMHTQLILRRRDRLELTGDGKMLYPYIRSAAAAQEAVLRRSREMQGIAGSVIRIGSFTSVSRNLLPQLMQKFRKAYPEAQFVLRQGTYTEIEEWLKEGLIDFGFNNPDAIATGRFHQLYQDEMMAVLPKGHALAGKQAVTLKELAQEPFILLDEGEYSATMQAFSRAELQPRTEYTVTDDYAIMAMVRQQLGVSMLYQPVISGFEEGLEIRRVVDMPKRTIGIVFQEYEMMPFASRRFMQFVLDQTARVLQENRKAGQ